MRLGQPVAPRSTSPFFVLVEQHRGVNGCNSDNTLIQRYLHWESDATLREGWKKTRTSIHDPYLARQRGEAGVVRENRSIASIARKEDRNVRLLTS
jgi:hypothetical protein